MFLTTIILFIFYHSVNLRRDRTILLSRLSIIFLAYVLFISYINYNIYILENGIGFCGSLFHLTPTTYIFATFILIISYAIIGLISYYPRKILIEKLNFSYGLLNYNLKNIYKYVYKYFKLLANHYAIVYIRWVAKILVLGTVIGLLYFLMIFCVYKICKYLGVETDYSAIDNPMDIISNIFIFLLYIESLLILVLTLYFPIMFRQGIRSLNIENLKNILDRVKNCLRLENIRILYKKIRVFPYRKYLKNTCKKLLTKKNIKTFIKWIFKIILSSGIIKLACYILSYTILWWVLPCIMLVSILFGYLKSKNPVGYFTKSATILLFISIFWPFAIAYALFPLVDSMFNCSFFEQSLDRYLGYLDLNNTKYYFTTMQHENLIEKFSCFMVQPEHYGSLIDPENCKKLSDIYFLANWKLIETQENLSQYIDKNNGNQHVSKLKKLHDEKLVGDESEYLYSEAENLFKDEIGGYGEGNCIRKERLNPMQLAKKISLMETYQFCLNVHILQKGIVNSSAINSHQWQSKLDKINFIDKALSSYWYNDTENCRFFNKVKTVFMEDAAKNRVAGLFTVDYKDPHAVYSRMMITAVELRAELRLQIETCMKLIDLDKEVADYCNQQDEGCMIFTNIWRKPDHKLYHFGHHKHFNIVEATYISHIETIEENRELLSTVAELKEKKWISRQVCPKETVFKLKSTELNEWISTHAKFTKPITRADTFDMALRERIPGFSNENRDRL